MPLWGRPTWKPDQSRPVDRYAGIAQGLSIWCPLVEGSGPFYEAMNGQPFPLASGAAWQGTPYGQSLINASDGVNTTTTLQQSIATPFTATVAFQYVSAFAAVFVWGNDNFSGIWLNSGGELLILNNGAGTAVRVSPSGLSAGNWCVVTVTVPTTSVNSGTSSTWPTFYLNGQATGTPTISSGTVSAPTVMRLGARGGSAQNVLDSPILWCAVHGRILAPGEIAAIGASPLAIFQALYQAPAFDWLLSAGTPTPTPTFMPWIFGDQVQDIYG